MPYTPPSQLSPPAHESDPSSAGNTNRTAFHFPQDRKQAEFEAGSTQRPTVSTNHAFTSTSYFRRHRRSPTVGKSICVAPGSTQGSQHPQPKHVVDPRASVQQSPPPVNDAVMPTGAIISPPESLCNSSDDEEDDGNRHKDKIMAELQAAIKSIERTRPELSGSSSNKDKAEETMGDLTAPCADPSSKGVDSQRPSLSKEARKISHSRSSSAASALGPTSPESSPEESDQDFEEMEPENRPPMVRKKSGELVRPALRPAARKRPSSMPGTPTFSKAVHFDSHLEHIRHFLQLDKPLAVSAGSSPVDEHSSSSEFPFQRQTELEIRLPNFPHDPDARKLSPVRLERLFLSSDKKKLVGSVAVANLAFHKHVVARFTLDYWKTTSEVVAEYNHDVRKKHTHDGYDRFYFNIGITDQVNLESKVMFICVRYNTNGREFWDNNNSMNYQVGFSRKEVSSSTSGTRSMQSLPHTLPRSRGSNAGARPKSMPPSTDSFTAGFNSGSFLDLGDDKGKKSKLSLSPTRSDDIVPEAPTRRSKPAAQAFGNRYDFGASLSAAMQPGSATLDRSGPPGKEAGAEPKSNPEKPSDSRPRFSPPEKKSSPPQRVTSISAPASNSPAKGGSKPAALMSGKPQHQSPVYKELVDKYCFVSIAQPFDAMDSYLHYIIV